jgi:porphyrinogen peroxidase
MVNRPDQGKGTGGALENRLSGMLSSMAGLLTGTRDALTRFSQPLTGSYYFVPSVENLPKVILAGS